MFESEGRCDGVGIIFEDVTINDISGYKLFLKSDNDDFPCDLTLTNVDFIGPFTIIDNAIMIEVS